MEEMVPFGSNGMSVFPWHWQKKKGGGIEVVLLFLSSLFPMPAHSLLGRLITTSDWTADSSAFWSMERDKDWGGDVFPPQKQTQGRPYRRGRTEKRGNKGERRNV